MLLRQLSVVLAFAFGAASIPLVAADAYAEDDDDWDDDDDDGGDGEYEEDEEDEEDDYKQPPRYAGGLHTKKTWPLSYVERNLILIGGMAEVRGGLDIDISDRTAFDVWRAVAELRYGIFDNFEVHGGANFVVTGEVSPTTASGAYNALFFFGMESAIAYELVNFRLTGELTYIDLGGGDTNFDIGFGFPFRYRFNEKVAIYALERLMTIQTNGSDPDFSLGASVAFQAVPQLAILGSARINVADFNFKDNAVSIPASIGILFAPDRKFDLGLRFTFLNMKPVDPDPSDDDEPAFYDQRSLLLFGQFRI